MNVFGSLPVARAALAGAVASLVLTSTVVPLHAQSGPVIPRPDTLGANFDIERPGTGSPTDWDFLVGKWTFRYQPRDQETGAYGPVQTGTWVGAKHQNGSIFEDDFEVATGSGPSTTVTFRVFDPASKRWGIEGVAVKRGVWQPGTAWADANGRYLVQDNPARGTRVRIRYYSITPDHFLWRADGSRDGGKTWMRDVMLIEATRAPSP